MFRHQLHECIGLRQRVFLDRHGHDMFRQQIVQGLLHVAGVGQVGDEVHAAVAGPADVDSITAPGRVGRQHDGAMARHVQDALDAQPFAVQRRQQPFRALGQVGQQPEQ